MAESSDRRILIGTLAALVAVSVVVIATVVANLTYIQSASDLRQHAYNVLGAAKDVPAALDQEDATRAAYRAAPNDRDLARLRWAQSQTTERLRQLLILTSDNPPQQARLTAVSAALAAWRGGWAGDDPRALFTDFQAAERKLAAKRGATIERAFRLTYITLSGGVLLGGVASLLILRRGAQVLIRAKHDAERASELSAQLLQFGRLDALGEMAGTLAHELNQPLTAASTYLSAARRIQERNPAIDPRAMEVVNKAAEQVLRATDIIKRLRHFIERGAVEHQVEHLPRLIEDARMLMLTEARRGGVTIEVVQDPVANLVLVDRIQVHQVLVNVIRNAIEAMADQERRVLSLTTGVAENGMAQVSVADSGPGISPEVAARLFQPFVTSKAAGMGVGLSMCRNMIESHGGSMWAERNDHGGATFHFTIPQAEGLRANAA